MSWALKQRYISDPIARYVLLVLSNYGGSDGRDAFPSVATLAEDTGLSERTIQSKLRLLEEGGAIVMGNQAVVAARISKADRRPVSYDIQIGRMIVIPAKLERGAGDAPRNSHPDNDPSRGANGSPREVERGAADDTNGVQLTTERGAGPAPNPSTIHPQENQKALSPQKPGEGTEGKKPAKRAKKEYPDDFLTAFEAYPKRDISPSKPDAFKAWSARIREGVIAADILAGVLRYAAHIRKTEKEFTQFVKMPATFFGPGEHWKSTFGAPAAAGKAADSNGNAVSITSQQRNFSGVDYGTNRVPGWMQAQLDAEEAAEAAARGEA